MILATKTTTRTIMRSRREMNKLVRHIVILLLFKINWRKLVLVSSIITIAGVIIQIYTLPNYPFILRVDHLSQPQQEMMPKNANNNIIIATDETLFVAPTVSTPIDKIDLVNNFTSLNQSMPIVNESIVTTSLNQSIIPIVNDSIIATSLNQTMPKGEKVVVPRQITRLTRRRRQRMKQFAVNSRPPPPPPPRPLPLSLKRRVWSMKPNAALAYAKKELENVSCSDPDPLLYAPIFRNVSIFQRSYDLMELILKVYIYEDGEKPIFHEPHLQGIYASEGWFMKLMEESRHFITKDPEKAHLFYLPYSARQLQLALYVPNSHNMRNLSFFLRDYANMLASKYPFWNRTRGRDHFLVACHDWGPYTLTEHEELTKNTIKVLCNADASEGIFVAGKDVSLPETTIRNPKRPLRNVGGGKRVSQRPILAFFAGHMHGRVRPILHKQWSDKDNDMRIYGPLPNRVSRNMSYVEHMKSSKYCICPMGYEVNSPRIVEAIYYECVPVIIADNFSPPLNEVFDWEAFSVTVAENDIAKLKEILLAIPLRRYLKMQTNVKMLQKHFHWNARPIRYDLFHMILHSIWFTRLNQFQVGESS